MKKNTLTSNNEQTTIIGGGPCGTLMAIFLAKRGHQITLCERLADPRIGTASAGRSINLALADRGIHALKQAGVFHRIEPLLVPVSGRMVHTLDGQSTAAPYGQRPQELIYSISRSLLTQALLTHAEQEHGVTIHFKMQCTGINAADQLLEMKDTCSGTQHTLPLHRVIGADGAGSLLRSHLVNQHGALCSEQLLAHSYKEFAISIEHAKHHKLSMQSLHIWPRGDFMLMALPNIDGSFTATLFMPNEGSISFAALTSNEAIQQFFQTQFPIVNQLIPHYLEQFNAHPTGHLGTVRCDRWTWSDQLILLGDAAHAIVPFHGQGMNCAFEDCVELDALLATNNWQDAATAFERQRIPNCNAIADMAIENYVEMRDTVRSPKFFLQKQLSLELESRFPDRFIPRYSMVMFHHEIPYATAFERGCVQSEILQLLTAQATSIEEIDFDVASQVINTRLTPLTLT